MPSPQGVTRQRCGLLPYYLGHLFYFVCDCVVIDLSVLLNKLNEGFIALAAQLQVTHEAIKVKQSKECIAVSNNLASLLWETHMLYGITQGYLPPNRGENPAFTRSRTRYAI